MPIVHGFDPPERFVAGTVGEPGSRTFFLQATAGARIVSVALEKQQVAALAERVDELLDEVIADGNTQGVIPAIAPFGLADDAPLTQPIEEEFRAGTMTLSWDPADERVVIEVFPVGDWTSWTSLVLPAITLAGPYIAYIARLMRTSMLEVLQQDYVRTARAKGMSESRVIYQHALKV